MIEKELAPYFTGGYKLRNELFAKWIEENSKRVIEIAAGDPHLASLVADKVEWYDWSDINQEFVDYANHYVKSDNFKAVQMDADKDYLSVKWDYFDTFICNALEHLKCDRGIMACLPKGMNVYFSAPRFPAYGQHLRMFENEQDVYDRYGDLVDIKELIFLREHFKDKKLFGGNKYVVKSVRK